MIYFNLDMLFVPTTPTIINNINIIQYCNTRFSLLFSICHNLLKSSQFKSFVFTDMWKCYKCAYNNQNMHTIHTANIGFYTSVSHNSRCYTTHLIQHNKLISIENLITIFTVCMLVINSGIFFQELLWIWQHLGYIFKLMKAI